MRRGSRQILTWMARLALLHPVGCGGVPAAKSAGRGAATQTGTDSTTCPALGVVDCPSPVLKVGTGTQTAQATATATGTSGSACLNGDDYTKAVAPYLASNSQAQAAALAALSATPILLIPDAVLQAPLDLSGPSPPSPKNLRTNLAEGFYPEWTVLTAKDGVQVLAAGKQPGYTGDTQTTGPEATFATLPGGKFQRTALTPIPAANAVSLSACGCGPNVGGGVGHVQATNQVLYRVPDGMTFLASSLAVTYPVTTVNTYYTQVCSGPP